MPLENLCLQGLLAKQPMKCANLVLQGSVIQSRHDFFATAGCGQTASRHQVAPLVWGNVISACAQCSSQVKDCRTELPARYAKLFSNVPIASTYLSLTRGSKTERDGRMVIYGLTTQEGNLLCEQMKQQFSTRYTGKLECVPSNQN